MHVVQGDAGWVEVVCGPMFSGKTEELLRRIRRTMIARQDVQLFKPAIDDRYDAKKVVSHSSVSMEATAVSDVNDISRHIRDSVQVVGIDEVQFFDVDVVTFVDRLAKNGVRVICAGLDLDFEGKPFGPMPALLSTAEYVTKTLAICLRCGAPAARSQRFVSSQEQVLVGASDHYEARCRSCHVPRPIPRNEQLFQETPGQA